MRLDELNGGILGADLVVDRHGGHVEKHDHQAPVLVLHSTGFGRSDLICGDRLYGCRRIGFLGLAEHRTARGQRGGGRQRLVGGNGIVLQFLILKSGDLLRLAVFRNGEVLRFQSLNGVAALVFREDVDHHQLHRVRKGEGLLLNALGGVLFRGGTLLLRGRCRGLSGLLCRSDRRVAFRDVGLNFRDEGLLRSRRHRRHLRG